MLWAGPGIVRVELRKQSLIPSLAGACCNLTVGRAVCPCHPPVAQVTGAVSQGIICHLGHFDGTAKQLCINGGWCLRAKIDPSLIPGP